MSKENVEFVEGLLAGTISMDKRDLPAALPELIEQTCEPESNGSRTRNALTGQSTVGMRVHAARGSDGSRTGMSMGARPSGSSRASRAAER